MAHTHHHGYLPLRALVQEHSARALRVLLEQGPQQGLLPYTKLAPGTKGWTRTLIEGPLVEGALPNFILPDICFRMKSAPPPLGGNSHF
jgi:hypothetical protein